MRASQARIPGSMSMSKMKTDWYEFPPLPKTAVQVQDEQERAHRERLERLAREALERGGGQLTTLITHERNSFEQHAPEVLERLRSARLEEIRCSKPPQQSHTHNGEPGHVALGPVLRLRTPVWTVAPMVTQCDEPFRLLLRRYGARLVYSEMLMADQFAVDAAYRAQGLGLVNDKVNDEDHPLTVQFAANDPKTLVRAGLVAQRCGADAIDINLGCPQNRARQGRYGSFITDPPDWPLCCAMVRACVETKELTIPVTCKIRLQKTVAATVEFAQMLEAAGCAMIAVHGRRRGDEKHRRSGPADLDAIAAVKAALHIPVLTNGNVSSFDDALEALRTTHCDGVMSAEEVLRDPALFLRCNLALSTREHCVDIPDVQGDGREVVDNHVKPSSEARHVPKGLPEAVPDAVSLSHEYLALALRRPPTSVWADGPMNVIDHHISRMIGNLLGARDFLKQPQTLSALAAPTLDAYVAAFRKFFASSLVFK